MTKEQKKDLQIRITQANRAGLIVILYEICLQYIKDAKEAKSHEDTESCNLALEKVRDCIDEMIQNLNYEYELSKNLKQLYIFCKKCIRESRLNGDISKIAPVERIIASLHESYNSIKDTDDSAPVMIHTQAILTGLTYSKNKVLDELTNDCSSRGFRV